MCIFIASSEFTDYAFVLLSNRDEYLHRETLAACVWPGGRVLAPLDASKEEPGTWIGISAENRIAVLVNVPEGDRQGAPRSRGVLAAEYLAHGVSGDWVRQQTPATAGFQLLMGQIRQGPHGLEAMYLLDHNYRQTTVFGDGPQTLVLSNGLLDAPRWPKVAQAEELAREAFNLHGPELVERLWSILETRSAGGSLTKTSIFVPVVELEGGQYGTRTQTIILVDHEGHVQYLEKDVGSGRVSSREWRPLSERPKRTA